MSQDGPWYKDGLRFTCTQCGDCCTGDPGVVWVDDQEMEQIAAHLNRTVDEVRRLHTHNVGRRVSLTEHTSGDCTFFDATTRKCGIYPVRPKQCRTWPFWNSNLESPEAWQEVQRVCPGAGRGDFVSLEEVIARASVIDV
jgi:Fe-S-cluster containining protein